MDNLVLIDVIKFKYIFYSMSNQTKIWKNFYRYEILVMKITLKTYCHLNVILTIKIM